MLRFLSPVRPQGVSVTSDGDEEDGEELTLTCNNQGARPNDNLQYSWQKNSAPILDATNRILSFSSLDYTTDDGSYSCVVSNTVGSSQPSDPREVYVTCKSHLYTTNYIK